ncbi:lactate racemase domain-containing protein [Saccharopolyspora sp. WRP15-2]|uniref:Lactate racemase domain-containing protein n=1 Tax=Saccharopolyspora oryzae TaxID=2997343 RepID=A0ABT4UUZ7_9PSEU|nr:lactate racemase domain-containing protein [Saccharopolyspora oryzae]MDA3625543.1 lactate racemase domain-containing protein [Saccharopolyspora oryzae]
MPRASVRWQAWFDDCDLVLEFPAGWAVRTCSPQDATDIGARGIAAAFAEPFGAPRLHEIAAGRTAPCVVIDDLSRPTPGARLIPAVLDELAAAGIAAEEVTVLIGAANHRPLMRADLLKKVGEEVLSRCRVRNHFSWTGCREIGTTTRGTPVRLNTDFLDADLKILVGSIVPHPVTGFSGGAKLVLPAVAAIESAQAFHTGVPKRGERLGMTETTARRDAEEAGRMAGVDFIVNAIPTTNRGIAGLVTGDLVAAHRAGVDIARQVYATPDPGEVDVAVFASYPKDNEFLQYSTALSAPTGAGRSPVRPGGTVVIATAATEGMGFHSLFGPGMPLGHLAPTPSGDFDLVIFSPGVSANDLRPEQRAELTLFNTWQDTSNWLHRKHGDHAAAAVFPTGTTQLLRPPT